MDSRGSHGSVALIRFARGCLRAVAGVLILAFSSAPSAGQGADDFWQTLRAERQPAVLLASAAPAAVPESLASGLRLFRFYELTGDAASARHARELLRHAEVPETHRAWHALALAMVLARGPDSRMAVGGDGDWFVDPNSLASAHSLRLLRTALELDPGLRHAALELATWALDRENPMVAAEAEIALARMPEDADALLARASLNLLLQDFDRAADFARRAQSTDADPSVARHTLAWALLQDARTTQEGLDAYFEGARALTDDGRHAYARTLEPLLGADELAGWRATPNADAAAWLERYWQRNAGRLGVVPAERLAEHYRRLQRARVEFPLANPLSVLEIQSSFATGSDSRTLGLSLRGTMLVRHGDPFRLASLEACLSNPWPGPDGTLCGGGIARLERFQAAGRLFRGETYSPFARDLAFAWGLHAFRGVRAPIELVYAISIPARSANALVESSGEVAGLVSAILIPDSGDVVRHDSAFHAHLPARLDPLGAGQADALALVHGSIAPPAGDSAFDVRITLSDRHRHAGATAGARYELPDLDGFALSDIVLAPADVEGAWRRGAVSIAFAPYKLYAPGESVRLYYEIYGLAENAPYRTEIEIRPTDAGVLDRLRRLFADDGSIRLRFDGVAPASHATFGVQELRTIGLTGLEPGTWRLRVVVTDATNGRAIERETMLDVGTPDTP